VFKCIPTKYDKQSSHKKPGFMEPRSGVFCHKQQKNTHVRKKHGILKILAITGTSYLIEKFSLQSMI
jgi:hypothetical protein